MIIIRKSNGGFLSKGAIVPDKAELEVMIHALIEERDRIRRSRGIHYGPMTVERLNNFIDELQKYQRERGA